MDKQKAYIPNAADRNALAALLVKHGYTVRIAKEKNKKGATVSSVVFWKGDIDD